MVDIKALIERCEEIIKNADELLRSETSKEQINNIIKEELGHIAVLQTKLTTLNN